MCFCADRGSTWNNPGSPILCSSFVPARLRLCRGPDTADATLHASLPRSSCDNCISALHATVLGSVVTCAQGSVPLASALKLRRLATARLSATGCRSSYTARLPFPQSVGRPGQGSAKPCQLQVAQSTGAAAWQCAAWMCSCIAWARHAWAARSCRCAISGAFSSLRRFGLLTSRASIEREPPKQGFSKALVARSSGSQRACEADRNFKMLSIAAAPHSSHAVARQVAARERPLRQPSQGRLQRFVGSRQQQTDPRRQLQAAGRLCQAPRAAAAAAGEAATVEETPLQAFLRWLVGNGGFLQRAPCANSCAGHGSCLLLPLALAASHRLPASPLPASHALHRTASLPPLQACKAWEQRTPRLPCSKARAASAAWCPCSPLQVRGAAAAVVGRLNGCRLPSGFTAPHPSVTPPRPALPTRARPAQSAALTPLPHTRCAQPRRW